MSKLVIAERGEWMRESGDVVQIETMTLPHLRGAVKKVQSKIRHIEATREQIVALQTGFRTMGELEEHRVLEELAKLAESAREKEEELLVWVGRHNQDRR